MYDDVGNRTTMLVTDGSDNLLRKYIFGPGIDEPVSMIDVEHSNATYYYHFDALGSVVALTNSSGSTVELYEYSVYGQVAASDANIPNRFMFTGREFDADTGLYYYRAATTTLRSAGSSRQILSATTAVWICIDTVATTL